MVVEIVPGLVDAARRFFGDSNRSVYDDARVRVVLDDARNFLATTRERFDVVIADLFVPWRSGAGALYTREHFEAVRSRLQEGGLFCQWLALYQLSREEFDIVMATFLDVFPRSALFRGDFYGRFPIVGLAKRLEEVFFPGDTDPALIPRASASLQLLQRIRNEAHRFAVTLQRKQRKQSTLTSELLEIRGVGKQSATKLIRKFGSVKKIREAGEEEIVQVVGRSIASAVLRHFAEEE